jgi:hypothetical protein
VSLADAGALFSPWPRPNVSARLDLSPLPGLMSGDGFTVATVMRSASTVAAATLASILLASASAAPTVGCGSAIFAPVVLESAAALPSSRRPFDESAWSGIRVVGASALVAIPADFAVLLARCGPRGGWVKGGFSPFHALSGLPFGAVELILNEASLIGGPAVRSRQASPFAPVHDTAAG